MPRMSFVTIPNTPRVIKATEARLERIYLAARLGMKGDNLALHSGMTPAEYNLLCVNDEAARLIALQGKADSEAEHAGLLAEASRSGDAKASLAILQHVHGWVAKQEISVHNSHTVDMRGLLALREERLQNLPPASYTYDHAQPPASAQLTHE